MNESENLHGSLKQSQKPAKITRILEISKCFGVLVGLVSPEGS